MQKLCNFRLVIEVKIGKEISESSWIEFLEKFLVNNFALSDAEDKNSAPLNRGSIADLHCWEHYKQFAKRTESQVSGKW